MLNIMKADLYRMIRGKGLYICILSIIALCSISIYMKSPGHMGFNGGETTNETLKATENPTSIEEIREIASNNTMALDEAMMQVNGNLYYPMIFIVFTLLCLDLSNHTAKNVIATNVSRTTYYLAKLILSCILSICFLTFSTYFGYFGNIIFNHPSNVSNILDITIILLRQIPIFCGIMSVLVMIAIVTKKASRFNGISIMLIMGVQMLLNLLVTIFNFDASMIVQFEFETILRSLAVVGGISVKTFVIGIGTGIALFVGSTAIGLTYFNKCNIR